ncbi:MULTISPECIES: hypothetical protein [Ruminococcus]|uniref:Uncharacterized protein n=1 Tax=Ruminococcus flavefaciens TaxID=1265 RepID=A0A1M7I3I7_RUMFL|nr:MULTISPECIES: hypothetical protein [Ruminococcus]MCR4795120.1 hypothetical protein [Ruminococcus sp.]SHM35228.1 hypothetical protein SAMN04487860_103262 [Ruminococcus flavefaciens]
MERNRIISLFLAFIAAGLVVLAGKSCMEDIVESNKEARAKKSATQEEFHLITEDNIFSSDSVQLPSEGQSAASQTEEEGTTREYMTVTNIFGEVVETVPVTSPEEANMPTTTLSILDEYNQGRTEAEVTTTYIKPADKIVIEMN